MRTKILVVFLLVAVSIALSQKRFYKGNTHTHSSPQSSDAAASWTPENVVASYKAAGYDFIVFTDHVAYWDASSWSSPAMTVFSGEEAGISGSGGHGHFTAMKITSQINGRDKTHQQLLNEIAGQGGLGFLNHPRWSVIPINALQVINDMKENLRFVEVYNHNTDTPTTFDTSLWDSVLTTGRLMYAVASDDAHREAHLGKAWICVYASSKHPDTLFRAIQNGDFYASNGIVLDSISQRLNKIFVRSINGSRITFIGSGGKNLAVVNAGEASYSIKGDEGYVRAQISNELSQTAWIQPLMLRNTTEVGQRESMEMYQPISLSQNFPNPFNPTTTIRYDLPEKARVRISIHNTLSQAVATLVDGEKGAGHYQAQWRAFNEPSGVYFCRIEAGSFVETKKMILLR